MDDVVVRAPQALDRNAGTSFRRTALGLLEERAQGSSIERLVVDLSTTRRVDSDGLGALVMIRQRASELRCTVRLRGVSEELRFLLVLTRLDDRFEYEPPLA